MPDVLITATGPDRPGLVDELSGFLHEVGANVADSRMVNLRGRFAVILLAEADDKQVEAIRNGLPSQAQRVGLSVLIEVQQSSDSPPPRPGRAMVLRTESRDQPGIVHRITHLLHEHNVNIEELQTRLDAAAYGQTPRFHMVMHLTPPADLDEAALHTQLQSLCADMGTTYDLGRP
jgi:glycine cleavage system transcriptional repressor